MPQLPLQYINAEAEDGTEYHYKASASVTTDGEFSVAVDPLLEIIVNETAGRGEWRDVTHKTIRGGLRVMAKQLDRATQFLKACAVIHITGKETTERIISYKPVLDVSFWQTKNGDILPNGGWSDGDGQWWKSKLLGHQFHSGSQPDGFAVGVSACVFDKITTTRTSGKTIRYKRVREHTFEEPSEACYWLNAWGTCVDPEDPKMREMPYTPEAAMFFSEVNKQLCAMARSIDNFLADEKKLLAAIQKGTKLLT